MPRQTRSWQEKLHDSKGHPTISPVSESMSKKWEMEPWSFQLRWKSTTS